MSDADSAEQVPLFETSLTQLQQIVDDLESGRGGLEQSLARFEEGVRLLRTCYQILGDAERKIELLVKTDAAGNPVAVPFDAEATYTPGQPAAKKAPRRRAATKSSAAETPVADSPPSPPDIGGGDAASGKPRLF